MDEARPSAPGEDPAPAVPEEPFVPLYGDRCLTSLVGVLAGVVGAGPGGSPTTGSPGGPGPGPGAVPAWLPGVVGEARQVVLVVLDGLGWEQLEARWALAPTLAGGEGGWITSVAPSTTATALTSLSTGLPPAVHGVVGYRLYAEGGVLNVLAWQLDGADARRRIPATAFQPRPCFPGLARPVPVVTRSDYAPTGFTAAHLAGTEMHGLYTPSGLPVEVRDLLGAGAPFVYAYFDGIDRVAHARGLGDHYEAELAAVDALVGALVAELPPGALAIVTADHGQVDVGGAVEVLGPELMDQVALLSGEGRFRWLHARPGAAEALAEAAHEAYGALAWVRTRDQAIAEGWFGGQPSPEVAGRLGDVVLAARAPTAFVDPADTGELRLAGRHGSLTPAEMRVPCLVFRGPGLW